MEKSEQCGMGEKDSLHVIMDPKNLFRLMLYMVQNVVFCGAKWPITINFGNNLSRNTVPEQYRDLPLFLVLELGELEYHIFLIHPC